MEAMRVPRPPIFTPKSNSFQWSVKPERSTAAGTLLMIWEQRKETIISRPASMEAMASRMAGMRPMFPMNTKKKIKVI